MELDGELCAREDEVPTCDVYGRLRKTPKKGRGRGGVFSDEMSSFLLKRAVPVCAHVPHFCTKPPVHSLRPLRC